jgi:outer membrane protein assembly factor BamE (lipoprotein component of BamABCDE complex)
MTKRILILSAAISALIVLGACAPRVATLGNAPRKEQLAKIKPGQTKEQVREVLGSPSSVAMFDKNVWYYISKREESFAFFKPTVKEQKVLIVRFTDDGEVKDVKHLSLADARKVKYVDDETPTLGREDGVLTSLMRIITDQRGILGAGARGGTVP